MKTYNLTIIIPHYNSSTLLEKLLSTIPKNKNIEVLVVDDKSEDKHINYIQKIAKLKKYTEFILLKNETSKKGAGTARNIGLKKATGEWILFADSDDYFTDIFYKSISKYFDSDNDVVFFMPTSRYIDTEENADRHIDVTNILNNYIYDNNKENELNLKYNMSPPWAKLIKKDFLNKNKITFDEVIAANDVMFSTKVGHCMRTFEISDHIIYVVTRSYGSLTANMSEEVFDIRFKIIINYHAFLKYNLSTDDFKLFNMAQFGRTIIVRSMKYGIGKLFKVIFELRKNNFKFFNYKLFNPLHLVVKTFHYKQKNKRNMRYTTNEKI